MPRILTGKEIKRLAWLSRLELTEDEERLFESQLNRILEYFARLDELDLEGVEPLYHVIDVKNVFREDLPRRIDPDDLLKVVPKKKVRYVIAPRMG